MLRRVSVRYVLVLYLVDLSLTVVAFLAARWLRVVLPYGKPLDWDGAALHAPMFALAWVIWSVALVAAKAYDPQRLAHPVDEAQAVISAIVVATLAFAGALYLSYRGLSRLLYLYFFALDVVFCLAARLILRRLMGSRRLARPRRVLIVGTGNVACHLAQALQPCAWMGIELLGYLTDAPDQVGQILEQRPVLGTLDEAREVVARHGVQEVILALPLDAQQRLADLVAALQELPVNIKAVPDYSGLVFVRATLEPLGDVLLVGLKEPVIGPLDRLIKRLFDLVVAALGLIVLSPLLGMIALAIALGSPGPVFYRSRRVGENGRVFDMFKFRTMTQDADRHEQDLIAETPDGKLLFNKRKDDARITPLGRFLRRYSLDELPQLYNVLIGEMSLVGPRPELPALVARYESWQKKRFSVPQGMTGWWQITGRSNKDKYLHAEDDLFYIQNYSLLLDLRIIWHTLGAVIKGDGAF